MTHSKFLTFRGGSDDSPETICSESPRENHKLNPREVWAAQVASQQVAAHEASCARQLEEEAPQKRTREGELFLGPPARCLFSPFFGGGFPY